MFEALSEAEAFTSDFATEIGKLLAPGSLIGLVGDLGAGKTCFVRGLAKGLEVPSTTRISSPTFNLVHEYPGRCPLIHVDLYRLPNGEAIEDFGLDDYLKQGAVCVIEWFDRLESNRFDEALVIHFAIEAESQRRLLIESRGTTYQDLERKIEQYYRQTKTRTGSLAGVTVVD